jgi:hypothetical protein
LNPHWRWLPAEKHGRRTGEKRTEASSYYLVPTLWRQEASESVSNEDNDARGPSRDSVMITDVISSRDEYDAVLDHGIDVRSQTIRFEASLGDVLLVLYE